MAREKVSFIWIDELHVYSDSPASIHAILACQRPHAIQQVELRLGNVLTIRPERVRLITERGARPRA